MGFPNIKEINTIFSCDKPHLLSKLDLKGFIAIVRQ